MHPGGKRKKSKEIDLGGEDDGFKLVIVIFGWSITSVAVGVSLALLSSLTA